MEIVDNLVVLAIPGAMDAGLGDLLFWGSLAFGARGRLGGGVPGQPLADRARPRATRSPTPTTDPWNAKGGPEGPPCREVERGSFGYGRRR